MPAPTSPVLQQCVCPLSAGGNGPYFGGVCPSVIVVGLTNRKDCSMNGFFPCDQAAYNGGTPANITTVYRQYSAGGSYSVTSADFPLTNYTISGNGLSGNYYDPATGLFVTAAGYPYSDFTNSSSVYGTNHLDLLGQVPDGADAVVTSPTTGNSGDEFNHPGSGDQVFAGELTLTLSDPDTEADAVARTTIVSTQTASNGFDGWPTLVNSIWETPNSPPGGAGAGASITFTYQTAKYCLICENLFASLNYKLTVNWQKRLVTNGGTPGAWVADATDVSTFNASGGNYAANGRQYLSGGTWSDANADGIITPDEVTPGVDLPFYEGYEVQIASIVLEWVP